MARMLSSLVLAAMLALGSTQVSADDYRVDTTPSAGEMAFDLVLIRPLGLAATVLGAGLFLVQMPFALIQGDAATPARRLIAEPAQFTFTRPLGAMD